MDGNNLPKFENPPVVETVLGVQFSTEEHLSGAHLGAFWNRLKGDWPVVQEMPPIAEQFETFTDQKRLFAQFHLGLAGTPGIRLQLRNAADDAMIQVQRTRFHYNWRGYGGATYPRYERVREQFADGYRKFIEFLNEEGITLRPNQWEVTYLNHLPKGSVWSHPGDWPVLFKGALPGARVEIEGYPLERFEGGWHFVLPEQSGRLHVQLNPAKEKGTGGRDLLVLNLTARGPIPEEASTSDILSGLDKGRLAIVRAFKDMTSDEAHQTWGGT